MGSLPFLCPFCMFSFSICSTFFHVFVFFLFFSFPSSSSPRAPPPPSLQHRFSYKNLKFQGTILGERRRRKEEERADRNRSPSTIARTGTFCYSRAWKPLTPTVAKLGSVCAALIRRRQSSPHRGHSIEAWLHRGADKMPPRRKGGQRWFRAG